MATVRLKRLEGGPDSIEVDGDALDLLLTLEEKAYDPRIVAGQFVVTSPGGRLSEPQRQLIAKHKQDLKRLVRYCEAVA